MLLQIKSETIVILIRTDILYLVMILCFMTFFIASGWLLICSSYTFVWPNLMVTTFATECIHVITIYSMLVLLNLCFWGLGNDKCLYLNDICLCVCCLHSGIRLTFGLMHCCNNNYTNHTTHFTHFLDSIRHWSLITSKENILVFSVFVEAK